LNWVVFLFLFLHVGGAILAFGPTYTFPFIGAMAGREPQHVNFALRLQLRLGTRLVIPLALFQAVTGVGLIWSVGIDVFKALWLIAGIVLYLIAISVSLFVLLPDLRELIKLTSAPPPVPAEGAAPSGPPPRVAALVRRSRMLGAMNGVIILIIVFLMVGGANGFL
jgi:hypothetical protein